MTPQREQLLIIASSGRMLASLAKNLGFEPSVIDCFADVDTQAYASQVIKVNDLSLIEVKDALTLLKNQSTTYVIYGSGLESHQSTLNYLAQNFTVLGNSPLVFATIQNKAQFFLTLKQRNINFPEICFQAPVDNENWLIKPLTGEGGVGIKWHTTENNTNNTCYWQKYYQGTPRSVLFVANTKEYQIIGYHKQFTTQIGNNEFVFSGLINQLEIDTTVEQTINKVLKTLVVDFSLQGINSLDFIEYKRQCYVLEINARPSASLNLYSSDVFSTHINSGLTGNSLPVLNSLTSYQAYKIIFADQLITINQLIKWPSWVVDIPQESAIIHTGMPICSIMAGGKNERQVEGLLLARQQQLMNLLR